MYSIKHLFHVNAPIEKVFVTLTTIEELSNWWTKLTDGSTKVGDAVNFRFGGDHLHKMKVIEVKTNEFVKWECIQSNHAEWVGTIITFKLDINALADGKTRVRFEQSNWKEVNDLFAACSFSWGRYMESIRQLCQTGKGEPFGIENFRK